MERNAMEKCSLLNDFKTENVKCLQDFWLRSYVLYIYDTIVGIINRLKMFLMAYKVKGEKFIR